MRTFIGMNFDEKLIEKLSKVQDIVKVNAKKGSWVNKNNFHMTLKFLGEINEYQIDDIGKILNNIACKYSPIELGLDEIGYFNKKGNQYGIIWIGLQGNVMKLNEIYDTIQKETQYIGFNIEKRSFKPHITIGRRINIDKSFDEIKKNLKEELKYNFLLDNLLLMKSEEIMGKRVYIPIKSYKLKNNDLKSYR